MAKREGTTHWRLFVDESGDFEAQSARAFLGAVALSVREDAAVFARFKASLAKQAPLVPWPLHRSLLKQPAIYPFWMDMAGEVELPEATRAAGAQALRTWHARKPARLAQVQQCLRDAREPEHNELRKLDATLKRFQPDAHHTLRLLMHQTQESVSSAFRAVFRDLQARIGPAHALSFFAAEADPGDAILDEPGERYFNLLVNLLQRVHDAIARLDGEHLIEVHLEQRWAKHPDLPERPKPGAPYSLPLTRSHIVRASMQAVEDFYPPDAPHRVRFSVGEVWKADAGVHTGIVIADSLANTFFARAMSLDRRRRSDELRLLHDEVRRITGIPAQLACAPALSHFSATGRAQQALADARAKRPTSLLSPGDVTRNWAGEQANQWIAYLQARGA